MTYFTRRTLGAAALGLAAAPALSHAQGRTILRIGWTSGDGAQDPYAIGARLFKQALERRVGERVDVQLFPNRALGDERPMLDGMRLGTVDMGVITNAVIAQQVHLAHPASPEELKRLVARRRQCVGVYVGAQALTQRLSERELGFGLGLTHGSTPTTIAAAIEVHRRLCRCPWDITHPGNV